MKKYRQYFTITYYIKIEMSYQSATYNRTSGSFGIQINGTDSSSNSTGYSPKSLLLNAPGVWMVEIFAYIAYSGGQAPFDAIIPVYENDPDMSTPAEKIVTSATNYTDATTPNVYLPNFFGASFSKTYVVNDANPSWTIVVKLGSQWTDTRTPTSDSKLYMKATKLC